MLLCPDSFGGTLSAAEAAAALAEGWRRAAPGDELVSRPLSDGGPGFLDVLGAALGGRRVPVATVDPRGRPVAAEVLLAGDAGYVESAQACGLHLLAPAERDPRTATSYGVGVLLASAAELGVREVVVGLGGSGTNDGGAGALAALGAAPLDAAGYALPYGGAALLAAAALGGVPRLRPVGLVAATDVPNPLTGPYGASAVYGPQKGARPDDVPVLDAALARFAGVLERDLAGCPPGLAALPGAGAAGGLGAALLALGARREPGFRLVCRRTGLDAALDAADLVVTGEGCFDHQSLRGKVVAGVAAAAQERGLPCVVVAGQVRAGRRESAAVGVVEAWSLAEHLGGPGDADGAGLARALAEPADGLRELAARVAAQWRRTGG